MLQRYIEKPLKRISPRKNLQRKLLQKRKQYIIKFSITNRLTNIVLQLFFQALLFYVIFEVEMHKTKILLVLSKCFSL